jgi:hypothetical protein
MSERSEFRSRREKRTENGVKNPIGKVNSSTKYDLDMMTHFCFFKTKRRLNGSKTV